MTPLINNPSVSFYLLWWMKYARKPPSRRAPPKTAAMLTVCSTGNGRKWAIVRTCCCTGWDDSLNLIIDYDLTMMSTSTYVRCFGRSRCTLLPAAANHIKYRWYSSNHGIFTRMDGEAYSLRPRRQRSTNQTSNRTWTQYRKDKLKADQ